MGYHRPKKEKEEERAFLLPDDYFFLPSIFITIICIPTSILLLNFFLENNKWWITVTVNISIFWILQFLSMLYIGFPLAPISLIINLPNIPANRPLIILYLFLDEFLITSLVSFGIQKLFLSN